MRAALAAAAKQHPQRIIIAVPVAPPEVIDEFRSQGIDAVALIEPLNFRAVGNWYHDFAPVTVATVRRLLTTRSTHSNR